VSEEELREIPMIYEHEDSYESNARLQQVICRYCVVILKGYRNPEDSQELSAKEECRKSIAKSSVFMHAPYADGTVNCGDQAKGL